MKKAALVCLALASAVSQMQAQSVPAAATPASNSSSAPTPTLIRQKYSAVEVDAFDIKAGLEFPPEYAKRAQDQLIKQLGDAKLFKDVLPAGQPPSGATPTIRVKGTIHDYNKGSRIKRYVAFGMGAAEVEAQISFLDAATGQALRVDETQAILAGGVFGGGDDKIADMLARRVVLETRFMLDRQIPPAGFDAAAANAAVSPTERHTLTMNAKNWSEGEQALERDAAAGYRLVNFRLTSQWTADLDMEKFGAVPGAYQYRWVHIRMGTHLQKEINKASADGFHVAPQTLTGLGPYLTVLMEKAPDPSAVRYQYLVTEPMTLSGAHKDAETRQRDGYALLDETEFAVHILLFEKATADASKQTP